MIGTPAITGITAKILVLVEKVLDCFVTVSFQYDPLVDNECCNIPVYIGTTTTCGDSLVEFWSQMLYQISGLGGHFLGALGVQVY